MCGGGGGWGYQNGSYAMLDSFPAYSLLLSFMCGLNSFNHCANYK